MSARADILVAGAGPWGLGTAWRAARAGARVVVVAPSAEPPAARVAAGMLGPWSEAADGEERLHALQVRALERWPAMAAELEADSGRDPGFRRSGAVLAAARPEHIGLVRRRAETIRRLGADAPWRRGEALRDIEPGLGPDVAGGVDLPGEHQAEPRAFLAALAAACEGLGVERVDASIDAVTGRQLTLTDGRRLRADRIVIAAGVGAGRLVPSIGVRAVKGQILRLRAPGGPPLRRTVRTPSVYLAPRDEEVVVGATTEERADRRVTAWAVRDLLDEALRVVPELAELELAEASAGLRPAAPDGMPVVGEDPQTGVVLAVGGHRHGVLLTPLAAQAAAAAALGTEPPAWADELLPRVAACA